MRELRTSATAAIVFAVSRDDAQRRTSRPQFPGGEIVELPVIEEMVAADQNGD
jgi:hypothetical protein